uniref:hypothetical protein n=1 Tax=Marinobacterium profundum TaxID=1714300 RepID=UPI001C1FEB6C
FWRSHWPAANDEASLLHVLTRRVNSTDLVPFPYPPESTCEYKAAAAFLTYSILQYQRANIRIAATWLINPNIFHQNNVRL